MSSASIDAPAAPAPERLDARTLARAKREGLRRRTRRIRRSVLGVAAVAFVTAFLIIYVQLASGHDPALSKRGAATSKTAATAADRRKQASAVRSSSSGTESSSNGTESSSSGAESSSGGAAESSSGSTESSGSSSSVTTSQS